MSSQLVSYQLPIRTRIRSAAIASTRRYKLPIAMHVHYNVKKAILNDLVKESSAQVNSSTPPPASLPWRVDVFAKAFEDIKTRMPSKTLSSEKKHNKIVRAWEPVKKEMWLERFGGLGETIERVSGKGTVVLRDDEEDGKGYLRVLI